MLLNRFTLYLYNIRYTGSEQLIKLNIFIYVVYYITYKHVLIKYLLEKHTHAHMCFYLIFIIQETNHRKESYAYTIIANQFRTSITTCHAFACSVYTSASARLLYDVLCVSRNAKKHFLLIVLKIDT